MARGVAMRYSRLSVVVLGVLLGGCSHLCCFAGPPPAPPQPLCGFHRLTLAADPPRSRRAREADPPRVSSLQESPEPGTVAAAVEATATRTPGAPAKMLFMSGGSQHGAFGAGLLDEWRLLGGGTLPQFKVVTGVSTGSILATFAFTGDTDVRTRLLGCYVDAILASSSAPLAAPPVFIDNVMYVDGGARFGVFSDDLGRLLVNWGRSRRDRKFSGPDPMPEPPVIVYLII